MCTIINILSAYYFIKRHICFKHPAKANLIVFLLLSVQAWLLLQPPIHSKPSRPNWLWTNWAPPLRPPTPRLFHTAPPCPCLWATSLPASLHRSLTPPSPGWACQGTSPSPCCPSPLQSALMDHRLHRAVRTLSYEDQQKLEKIS